MLKALWPSTARIPNHLPGGANTTTAGLLYRFSVTYMCPEMTFVPIGMMCYFLYWLLQFPFMFVSPQKIRHLFMAKAITVPISWLAILIWAVIKVPITSSLENKHTLLRGSALSWAWLSALNSALGFYATLTVNIPDFTVSQALQGTI